MTVEANQTDAAIKIPPLCAPLDEILRLETEAGNEVTGIHEGGWSKIDLSVTLKLPFHKNYDEDVRNKGVTFYRNEDPHYPFNDSYTSAGEKQAIDAPTAVD